ncbi:hypothetical protein [Pseudomonas phage D6]|nr:hypothetical protein [Pseudomonas phage D6]
MTDLEYLIDAIKEKVQYHSIVGVGLRLQVLVAAQNEKAVYKAVGEIVHTILRGTGWENKDLSESELELRTTHLLKDLFYSKRIVLEVKVKEWPETVGNHLQFCCGSWDHIIYDKTVCERYLAYLERN